MKSKVVKVGVSSILFFSMILASLALVRPVIGGFAQRLQDYRDQVLSLVEAKTGLRVSYDSLSPAILSAFRIKGIVLSAADTGIPVLSIRKASLSYSIPALLSGNLDEAFSKLTVTGITLEYDALQSNHVLEKLMALVAVPGEAVQEEGGGSPVAGSLLVSLPFEVEVQDVSLHYRDTMMDVLVFFRDIVLSDIQGGGFIQAETEGSCLVTIQDKILDKMPEELRQEVRRLSMDFALDASIMPNFDGSTAGIKISSLNGGYFSLGGISFLAVYNQGMVTLSTAEGFLPFMFMAEVDTQSGGLDLLVEMDRFAPFSYVQVQRSSPVLDRIRGVLVSGSYELQMGAGERGLSYQAQGDVSLPAGFFTGDVLPGETSIRYGFSGDGTDISIGHLSVSSQNLEFSMEGKLNLPQLQMSGFAYLERLSVPGSGDLSAELYIDPLNRGFTCFVPQLYYGDRSFTALQLTMIPAAGGDSLDFEFEASDYSHIDFGVPGLVKVSGSLLNEERPYLQASLGINDFFLESAVDFASFFVPQEQRGKLESLAGALAPYVTTNELYVATDFSSVSYNVDYWILADTANDDNLLIFSFTGNESTLSLSQFDLLVAGQNVQMTGAVDLDEGYTQAFFSAEAVVNSVPYSLSGSFVPGAWLNVAGSYGLSASFAFGGEENAVEGQVSMEELPLSVGSLLLLCSLDMQGVVPRHDVGGFSLDVSRLRLWEVSNLMPSSPQLTLSGQVNRYGFMLDSLLFQDAVSTLTGAGGASWNIAGGRLESAGVNLILSSTLPSESYSLGINFSNPEQRDFSQLDVMRDLYFTMEMDVAGLPMTRFSSTQPGDATVTGIVTAMGTFENPYIDVRVSPSSVYLGGKPLQFSLGARLEDGDLYLEEAQVMAENQSITGISAGFSLKTFSGFLRAKYDGQFGSFYTMEVPLEITVSSSMEGASDSWSGSGNGEAGFVGMMETLSKGLPDFISMNIGAVLGGSLFSQPEPVDIALVRIPGYIAINSGDNLGISGSIEEGGRLYLRLAGRMPIHGVLEGSVMENELDIRFSEIVSDLSKFKGVVAYPFIMLHGGILSGSLHLGGFLSDPEFDGRLVATNLTINCPDYVPELMVCQQADILFEGNELRVSGASFDIKGSGATLDLSLLLDRWLLDLFTLRVNTVPRALVPARINIPAKTAGGTAVLVEGKGSVQLEIDVTMSTVDVRGDFYTEDVDINIIRNIVGGNDGRQPGIFYGQGEDKMDVTLDLNVTTGQKVEIVFDPLLRGLIAPNTKGQFRYDSATESYSIVSDIVLRGGELTYLNRNFYLREGRLVFTENDSLDPQVTVRAEIREYDQDGEPVRISLAAENQRLSAFNPTYSSSPAKSEMEIMTILGQALTGDVETGWDILFSGVDYGFQVLVLRKLENALRDLLNFDIFSLRTMGLQNSLKQWLNPGEEREGFTIGNFLDHTTVYIGKYFGSSIYADAMLHCAYEGNKVLQDPGASGLVFQPEIGLEMDSPFGAIRWSIAPELGTTQHLWVPATSISLSWKFVF